MHYLFCCYALVIVHIEDFRGYCLAKPGTTEELPFDNDTLVFKVGGKMFALCSLTSYDRGISLKCEPEKAIVLREQFPQVRPGYHMSKQHWNTVLPEAGLRDQLLYDWIDDSYRLVWAKLIKKVRQEIAYNNT